MDLLDLFVLLLFAGGIWLWLDSLRTRELAMQATRAACASEQLLLLDDTVAIRRLSLRRDGHGVLRLQRVYDFEYSDTGNDRAAGSVVLLGHRVLVINLNLRQRPDLQLMH